MFNNNRFSIEEIKKMMCRNNFLIDGVTGLLSRGRAICWNFRELELLGMDTIYFVSKSIPRLGTRRLSRCWLRSSSPYHFLYTAKMETQSADL